MIRILEDRVVNRIAAGEVVERPAAVVKELVENSLDAGATDLRIALRAGGRDLIQVTDNGVGMSRQDATLCLERHATSKIRAFEDLETVRTLGFRGEALPSIASVSRFVLRTRPAEQDTGTRVTVEGGRLSGVREDGGPKGTSISVRTLFFNVPARRKFLRTVPTELSHCLEAVRRACLMRPEVDVEVLHEGRTLLRAPATDDPRARLRDVIGADAEELLAVDLTAGELQLVGHIAPHDVHRNSATGAAYHFVNGRFVRDPLLRRAVAEAYRGLMPRGRHPVVVLDLRLPTDLVDCNVHPAKTEVRFADGRAVQRVVAESLRDVLEQRGIKRRGSPRPVASPQERGQSGPAQLSLTGEELPVPPPPRAPTLRRVAPLPGQGTAPAIPPDAVGHVGEPAERGWRPSFAAAPSGRGAPVAPQLLAPRVGEHGSPSGEDPAAGVGARPGPGVPARVQAPTGGLSPVGAPALGPPPGPSAQSFRELRVLGQLGAGTVVCADGPDLVLVDEVAARRAILAHELRRGEPLRALPEPVVVHEAGVLGDRAGHALELGLDLAAFGDADVLVRAVPLGLRSVAPQRLVELACTVAPDHLPAALAQAAVHSSGRTLSPYELRGLLRRADAAGLSLASPPNGVVVRIPGARLEDAFSRGRL